MPTDRPEPDAILCRSCGYPIDLTEAGGCPECGESAEASAPALRTGSPWQRSPGLRSWMATGWLLLRWRRLFDRISIEPSSAVWLTRVNLALAAVLIASAFLSDDLKRLAVGFTSARPAHAAGALLIVTPAAYFFIAGLTRIERAGLRFFGNRRGGRVTPGIAAAVCGHASYGWVLAGLLALVGAILGVTVLQITLRLRTAGWLIGAVPIHLIPASVGFFGGLLVFETLSYLGVSRCRFANPQTGAGEIGADRTNESDANAEPTLKP